MAKAMPALWSRTALLLDEALVQAVRSASEPQFNPHLRLFQADERGWVYAVNRPESHLQKPPASLLFVLLAELHEDRDEEAVRKYEVALGVIAARRDTHRLEVKAHPSARSCVMQVRGVKFGCTDKFIPIMDYQRFVA